MASALILTVVGTRNGKLRSQVIFRTAEVRSQVDDVLTALRTPESIINDLRAESAGFEIPGDIIRKAKIESIDDVSFINSVEFHETTIAEFAEAQRELASFDESFEDVRVLAEIA